MGRVGRTLPQVVSQMVSGNAQIKAWNITVSITIGKKKNLETPNKSSCLTLGSIAYSYSMLRNNQSSRIDCFQPSPSSVSSTCIGQIHRISTFLKRHNSLHWTHLPRNKRRRGVLSDPSAVRVPGSYNTGALCSSRRAHVPSVAETEVAEWSRSQDRHGRRVRVTWHAGRIDRMAVMACSCHCSSTICTSGQMGAAVDCALMFISDGWMSTSSDLPECHC